MLSSLQWNRCGEVICPCSPAARSRAHLRCVDRQGCELILSSQWPDKVGTGLIFISLDVSVLDALRAELEGRGVNVKDGYWGYPLMVVHDPDGNELYFPYPSHSDAQPADKAS